MKRSLWHMGETVQIRRLLFGLGLVALSSASYPAVSFAQDDWFAKDKAAHFGVGLAVSAGGYGGAALMTDSERARIFMGIGAGIGSAAAKELWDRSHSGTSSWRDFTWSAIGTAAGVTITWLIDRARNPRTQRTSLTRPAPPGPPGLPAVR